LHSKAGFEARDCAAQHRRRGAQRHGTGAEGAFFHNCDEGFHVGQMIESTGHYCLQRPSDVPGGQFIAGKGINTVSASFIETESS
jgi:hypothetical protein